MCSQLPPTQHGQNEHGQWMRMDGEGVDMCVCVKDSHTISRPLENDEGIQMTRDSMNHERVNLSSSFLMAVRPPSKVLYENHSAPTTTVGLAGSLVDCLMDESSLLLMFIFSLTANCLSLRV